MSPCIYRYSGLRYFSTLSEIAKQSVWGDAKAGQQIRLFCSLPEQIAKPIEYMPGRWTASNGLPNTEYAMLGKHKLMRE
jgi:hypothetical protein